MATKKPLVPFQTTHFIDQLVELSNLDLPISSSRGSKIIQQTFRNTLRRYLLDGLIEFFNDYLDSSENLNGANINVYRTEEGIVVEVENHSLILKDSTLSGMVSLLIDVSFKSLDFDAYDASIDYEETK